MRAPEPPGQRLLQAMIGQLNTLAETGINATGAYETFINRELEEAAYMAQGLSYETSHQMALEALGHSPYSIYIALKSSSNFILSFLM